MIQHQGHDQEVAIFQTVCGLKHLWWGRRVKRMDQFTYGHRVDEMLGLDIFSRLAGAIFFIPRPHVNRGHAIAIAVHLHDFRAHLDSAALFFDQLLGLFPHHPRAKARILKFLDQAGGVIRP